MVKVILHIGRHKTGTSSLQRFLVENSEFLTKHRICYPSNFLRGIAHHHLAEPFRPGDLNLRSEAETEKLIEEYGEELRVNLTNTNVTYIISSEAFQNVAPSIVRRLFDKNFFDVKVVAYFRDQVGYLASAYNQRVHATTYSGTVYQYFRDYFRSNYEKFSEKWEHSFPGCCFRIYDRERLYRGDLIADFFSSTFDIEVADTSSQKDGNPSLSSHYLNLKLELNRLIKEGAVNVELAPKHAYRRLGRLSQQSRGQAYVLPRTIGILVYLTYYRSNRRFVRKHIDGKGFTLKSLGKVIRGAHQCKRITEREIWNLLKDLIGPRSNVEEEPERFEKVSNHCVPQAREHIHQHTKK